MAIQLVTDEFGLLALCALMPSFTGAYLRQLASVDSAMIERLLLSDQVLKNPDLPGYYRLNDAASREALSRLRREAPDYELALHIHVVQSVAVWQPPERGPAEQE